MAERIEVVYAVNGTTKRDSFTADGSRVQVWPKGDGSGLGDVAMEGGRDKDGPVKDVLYTVCYRIVRRPIDEGNGS